MILFALVAFLIVFVLSGMEIAWAIGLTAFICIALSQFTDNPLPFVVFAHEMTSGINSFTLLSIPLFILAGELLTLSGATLRLVDLASALVGHLNGGLANVAVTANFVVSGMSGSAMADAAATGVVLVPEMKRRGYPVNYACAVIACAATVGPLVPPSLLFIVLGASVNLSVGRLFLAGLVPAFIVFLAMYALTWRISKQRNFPLESEASVAAAGAHGADRPAAVGRARLRGRQHGGRHRDADGIGIDRGVVHADPGAVLLSHAERCATSFGALRAVGPGVVGGDADGGDVADLLRAGGAGAVRRHADQRDAVGVARSAGCC